MAVEFLSGTMVSCRPPLEMNVFSRVVRFYVDSTPFKISLDVVDVVLGVIKWLACSKYLLTLRT